MAENNLDKNHLFFFKRLNSRGFYIKEFDDYY